jgi:signal peptidase II
LSPPSSGIGRAALVATAVLALDQASKAAVTAGIERGERIELLPGLGLVRVSNEGIAFGLLGDAGPAVIVISALAFLVLLGYFMTIGDRRGMWLPIGLLAGGALGNLIDRFRLGAVTDFIDLPRWPAFNVADIAITAGVAVLVVLVMRDGSRQEDAKPQPPGSDREAGSG